MVMARLTCFRGSRLKNSLCISHSPVERGERLLFHRFPIASVHKNTGNTPGCRSVITRKTDEGMLPGRMEITPYNNHEGFSASPDPVGLGPQPNNILDRRSLRSYPISFEF